MNDVVITGVGTVSPLGEDVESSWETLLHGESGIGHLTNFDPDDYEHLPDLGAEVDADLRECDRVNPRRMGRFTQLAVQAATEAFDDAELVPEELGESVVAGTSIATALGGIQEMEQASQDVESGGAPLPRRLLQILPNMGSGFVSIEFGLEGPSRSSSAACAAGSNAIADAVADLRSGRADLMVAGGGEAPLSPLYLTLFDRLNGLSGRVDAPREALRPFDVDRDGTVFGEGSGVMILETRKHARERGARPLAEILGVGLRSDATNPTQPRDDAAGLTNTMRAALSDADLQSDAVDAVVAHATGTPVGDKHEMTALTSVFERCPPVTGIKSSTGHLVGASGAFEAVCAVRSIRENTLAPTRNHTQSESHPEFPVVTRPTDANVETMLTNALGFGGTNCSLLIGTATA